MSRNVRIASLFFTSAAEARAIIYYRINEIEFSLPGFHALLLLFGASHFGRNSHLVLFRKESQIGLRLALNLSIDWYAIV